MKAKSLAANGKKSAANASNFDVLPKSALALLEATGVLLARRPAVEVTLADISDAAGVSSALIKYYFGNKDGLMIALLEREAIAGMRALNHLIEMDIPATEKLRIHIGGMVNAYFKAPYLNRLIHYMIENGEPAHSKRVEELYTDPLKAAYRAMVQQGLNEKSFRPVDPYFLYYSVVGACDHLFVAHYSERDESGMRLISAETKQNYAAHVTDMYLRGILA